MTAMTEKFKNKIPINKCRHCNNRAAVFHEKCELEADGVMGFVLCQFCKARGPIDLRDLAIEAWNNLHTESLEEDKARGVREITVRKRGEKSVDLLRPYQLMKFAENSHKPGWKEMDLNYGLSRLREEVCELADEVLNEGHPNNISRECADVANFACMINEAYRNHYEKETSGEQC